MSSEPNPCPASPKSLHTYLSTTSHLHKCMDGKAHCMRSYTCHTRKSGGSPRSCNAGFVTLRWHLLQQYAVSLPRVALAIAINSSSNALKFLQDADTRITAFDTLTCDPLLPQQPLLQRFGILILPPSPQPRRSPIAPPFPLNLPFFPGDRLPWP